jgi:hypothetical protein
MDVQTGMQIYDVVMGLLTIAGMFGAGWGVVAGQMMKAHRAKAADAIETTAELVEVVRKAPILNQDVKDTARRNGHTRALSAMAGLPDQQDVDRG